MSNLFSKLLIYFTVSICLTFIVVMAFAISSSVYDFNFIMSIIFLILTPFHILFNKFLPFRFIKRKIFDIPFKILFVVFSAIVGFLLSFQYLVIAGRYSGKLCFPLIPQESKTITNKYRLTKSHYQLRDCERKMLPIPWIEKPQVSDNPPGFKSFKDSRN